MSEPTTAPCVVDIRALVALLADTLLVTPKASNASDAPLYAVALHTADGHLHATATNRYLLAQLRVEASGDLPPVIVPVDQVKGALATIKAARLDAGEAQLTVAGDLLALGHRELPGGYKISMRLPHVDWPRVNALAVQVAEQHAEGPGIDTLMCDAHVLSVLGKLADRRKQFVRLRLPTQVGKGALCEIGPDAWVLVMTGRARGEWEAQFSPFPFPGATS